MPHCRKAETVSIRNCDHLSDLDNLNPGSAIKVPLAERAESKEKVRSVLNGATRKAGRKVMTASDTNFLWDHGH